MLSVINFFCKLLDQIYQLKQKLLNDYQHYNPKTTNYSQKYIIIKIPLMHPYTTYTPTPSYSSYSSYQAYPPQTNSQTILTRSLSNQFPPSSIPVPTSPNLPIHDPHLTTASNQVTASSSNTNTVSNPPHQLHRSNTYSTSTSASTLNLNRGIPILRTTTTTTVTRDPGIGSRRDIGGNDCGKKEQQVKKENNIYQDLITIDLGNKGMVDLREFLSKIVQEYAIKAYNGQVQSGEHYNSQYTISPKIQLYANDNALTSCLGIYPLHKNLISLKLHNNKLQSLTGLSPSSTPSPFTYPLLQKLYLEYNSLTSIASLSHLSFPSLIRLSLNNNNLTSDLLQPLSTIKAPELLVLSLDGNFVDRLDFLEGIMVTETGKKGKDQKVWKLLDLTLSNNRIENISILGINGGACMGKLSKLQLNGNRIRELSGLRGIVFGNLRRFVLSNNYISTAQPLISCVFTNLQILQMQGNEISNLNFLKRLQAPKLIDLKLSRNRITYFSPQCIKHGVFPQLQQLLLKNNQMSGLVMEHLMVSFADTSEIREEFHMGFFQGNVQEIVRNGKKQRRIIERSKEMMIYNGTVPYNDNRKFAMFSCWKNRVIAKNGPNVYTRMKRHFKKLSFLQF